MKRESHYTSDGRSSCNSFGFAKSNASDLGSVSLKVFEVIDGFTAGVSRIGAATGTYGAPVLLCYSARRAMLAGAAADWGESPASSPETSAMTLGESKSATIAPNPITRTESR